MKCSRCHHELAPEIGTCLHCDSLANPTQYFYTPPGRLLFFYLISLGLYGPYWFYKNTAVIKKAKGNSWFPLWKVLLGVILLSCVLTLGRPSIRLLLYKPLVGGFFCIVLTFLWVIPLGPAVINNIYRDAEKYGYPITFSYVASTGTFAISSALIFLNLLLCALLLFFTAIEPSAGYPGDLMTFMGLLCVATIHLSNTILVYNTILISQRAIKFHNNQVGYTNKRPLSSGEKILLALYLLWLLLIGTYKIKSAIMNQKWETFHASHHTFQVILPGAPDAQDLNRKAPIVIDDKNLTVCYDVYSRKDSLGNAVYYIGVVQNPPEIQRMSLHKEQILQQQILAGLLGTDAQSLSLLGYLRRENDGYSYFELAMPGQYWHGKIIFADEQWYYLITEYTKPHIQDEDIARYTNPRRTQRQKEDYYRFINSFELKTAQ